MTTLDQARAGVLAVLDDAGVTRINTAGTLEPKDSGRLLVVADDIVTAVQSLITATSPRFATLTPDNDDEFSVHLIGTPWVAISVTTQEALDEDDAAPPPEDDELWAVVDVAVTELATTPLGAVNHHDMYKVLDLLVARVAETRAELGERLAQYPQRNRIWEAVTRLQAELKDAHVVAMRRDAHEWAEKVYAADPVPAGARRPVFRDAAYRFMKRVDEDCATRISTETIATELERVATEHASSLTV